MQFRALHTTNLRDLPYMVTVSTAAVRYSYCAWGHDKRDRLHQHLEQRVRLFLGFPGTRRLNTVFITTLRWTHCF